MTEITACQARLDQKAGAWGLEYRDLRRTFYQFLQLDAGLYPRIFGGCGRASSEIVYRNAAEIPPAKRLRVLRSLERDRAGLQNQPSPFGHNPLASAQYRQL